jgi:hypothetical protein
VLAVRGTYADHCLGAADAVIDSAGALRCKVLGSEGLELGLPGPLAPTKESTEA